MLSAENIQVTLADLRGKEMYITQATQNIVSIELENEGVYFVYIKTKKGTTSKKLVISLTNKLAKYIIQSAH